MKGELRQMVAQGSGAIVNCSSIGGIVEAPDVLHIQPASTPSLV
jgi:short-subunit dehydrogenase